MKVSFSKVARQKHVSLLKANISIGTYSAVLKLAVKINEEYQ